MNNNDVSDVLRRPDNVWFKENMKKSGASRDGQGDNPALNIGPDAPITVLKPPFYTDTGGHFNEETGAGYAQPDSQEEIDDEEGFANGGLWIAGATQNKGGLHRSLGVPQGQKIPAAKEAAAAKEGGKVGKEARLAETLKGLSHKR